MNHRFSLFFILSFNLVGTLHGQFSMEAFLATSRSDLALKPVEAKMSFLKANDFRGPWINRLEFRTGSDNLDFSLEDFRLRITPGNPAELRANNRYYDKQTALLNIEYLETLSDAIKNRYLLMIDHYFECTKKATLEKQIGINRQLIDLMTKSTGEFTLDLGDLIDAQSDDLDMTIKIEDSKIYIDELEYTMKEWLPYTGVINWEEHQLMDIDGILKLFTEMREQEIGQHIELAKLEQKNALAAERYNIEKSEALRNIGYLQADYVTDRGDVATEHFGYQIGVRIPIVNPDKPALNRRKLDLMDDEAELKDEQDKYRKEMELAALRMNHFAVQYNEIESKLELLSKQNLLNYQKPDENIKMADLLKMNEYYLDLLDKKRTTGKNIFQNYIEYLDLSGKISELPLKNYLSRNLSEF
jgi:hypothetical protein